MAYVNGVYLNRDISSIKTSLNEINIKILNHTEQLKYFNDIQKTINGDNAKYKSELDKKINKDISSITDMMVDVISDVQFIRRELDALKENKITEEIIQVENKTLTEKKDKAKEVLEFLESLDFENKYDELVINMGCKSKEDLKLFTEEELVKSGFLLLHARKVLKK
jgi:hypothetical protein